MLILGIDTHGLDRAKKNKLSIPSYGVSITISDVAFLPHRR
jgi:hypothetical protein